MPRREVVVPLNDVLNTRRGQAYGAQRVEPPGAERRKVRKGREIAPFQTLHLNRVRSGEGDGWRRAEIGAGGGRGAPEAVGDPESGGRRGQGVEVGAGGRLGQPRPTTEGPPAQFVLQGQGRVLGHRYHVGVEGRRLQGVAGLRDAPLVGSGQQEEERVPRGAEGEERGPSGGERKVPAEVADGGF